jgi:hypothetical protein
MIVLFSWPVLFFMGVFLWLGSDDGYTGGTGDY